MKCIDRVHKAKKVNHRFICDLFSTFISLVITIFVTVSIFLEYIFLARLFT